MKIISSTSKSNIRMSVANYIELLLAVQCPYMMMIFTMVSSFSLLLVSKMGSGSS